MKEEFRENLLSYCGLSKEGWGSYWELMKEFRDRQVAHYEVLSPDVTYPTLDHALTSSYFYYSYVIAELRQ
jgi:hypothetical protein